VDFIERLLHISPDGGNGLTEIGLLLALAACTVVLCRWALLASGKGKAGLLRRKCVRS
jgi:hypothetical protein